MRKKINRIRNGSESFKERKKVEEMNDIEDMNKDGKEREEGMESIEIDWCEEERLEKRNGKRIENGKMNNSGSGGRKKMREGLSRIRKEKKKIRREEKG